MCLCLCCFILSGQVLLLNGYSYTLLTCGDVSVFGVSICVYVRACAYICMGVCVLAYMPVCVHAF